MLVDVRNLLLAHADSRLRHARYMLAPHRCPECNQVLAHKPITPYAVVESMVALRWVCTYLANVASRDAARARPRQLLLERGR